jgi:hypothetical protein
MRLDHVAIKTLREGGSLVGQMIISSQAHASGTCICGSMSQVQQVMPPLNEGLKQLLDVHEGLLFLEIEQASGQWTRCYVDLDGDLGALAMEARRPLCMLQAEQIPSRLQEIEGQKTLPLQPEFEQQLVQALNQCNYRFMQRADGSFKLNRMK